MSDTQDQAESDRRDVTQLPPAAQRALAEAQARREQAELANNSDGQPKEEGGRKGPEPTRFGDWEKSGIAVDF